MRWTGLLAAPLIAQMSVPTCGGAAPPPATGSQYVFTVTPGTASLSSLGATVQLAAQLQTASGAPAATSPITWISTNANVVTVDATGLATAHGEGRVTIQASVQPPDASAVLTGTAVVSVTLEQWTFLGAITTASGGSETQVCGVAIDPRDDRVIYAAATSGLYVSRNMGGSWTSAVAVAPNHSGCGPITIDPARPDRVWYSSILGPVSRTEDGGRTWHTIPTPFSTIEDLVLSQFEPGAIIASSASSTAGSAVIWISRDDGASWMPLPFGSARPDLVSRTDLIAWSIGEDPLDGTLYTSLELGQHPQPYHPPLMRSTDRGASWQDVAGWNQNPPPPTIVPWHALRELVDPPTHAALIFTEGSGLYRSTDHGATWARWGNGTFTQDLVRDEHRPDRYFGSEYPGAGRAGGVYVSSDAAVTFASFGLTGRQCNRLALSSDSSKLFVACWQSGLYMTPLPW